MAPANVSSLAEFQLDPASVQLLGYGFARRKQVVVLGVVDPGSDAPISVGMIDPTDGHLLRHLGDFLGRTIMPVRLSEYDIAKALDQGYGRWAEATATSKLVWSPPEGADADPEHPLQRVLDELLHRGVTQQAEAIHVETSPNRVRARLRIDGRLREVAVGLQPDTVGAFIARVCALAGIDRSGDPSAVGSLPVDWKDGETSRRIQAVVDVAPATTGDDLLIRLHPVPPAPLRLDELGLLPAQLEVVQTMLTQTQGLVLVAGPRRTGCTTTLAAALSVAGADPSTRVVSVSTQYEPPIEGVTQHVASGVEKLAGLLGRAALRDTDAIGVSSLPNVDCARGALQAAHAGRLVLAGIEASEPGAALARLRAHGLEDALLADAVLGVVAQRLVRRLCPHCTEPMQPDAMAESFFERTGRRFKVHRGRGCEHCDQTGFSGRLGLFEVMPIDPDLAHRIACGEPAHQLRAEARGRGMTTFLEAGLKRVEQGQTTLEEVRRAVPIRLLAESSV